METIDINNSPIKLILVVVLISPIVLMGLGGSISFTSKAFSEGFKEPLAMLALLTFFYAFTALMLFVVYKYLSLAFSSKPRYTLDQNGITDQGRKERSVDWVDITDIKPVKNMLGGSITFKVIDQKPLTLNCIGTKGGFDECYSLVMQYYRHAHKN